MKNDAELQILKRLDELVRLTAAQVISGKKLKEQVRLLSSVGMQPKEIARLLDKSPNSIRVTLFRIGKEKNEK